MRLVAAGGSLINFAAKEEEDQFAEEFYREYQSMWSTSDDTQGAAGVWGTLGHEDAFLSEQQPQQEQPQQTQQPQKQQQQQQAPKLAGPSLLDKLRAGGKQQQQQQQQQQGAKAEEAISIEELESQLLYVLF